MNAKSHHDISSHFWLVLLGMNQIDRVCQYRSMKLATDKKVLEYGRIRLDCLLVQSRRKEQRCFAKEKPPSLRSYAPCDDELKLEKLRKFTAIFAICAVLRTPVSYSARSSSRSRQPQPVTTSACCSATEIWMDRTPGPQGYR